MQVADMLSTEGADWAVQAAFAQAVMVQRNKLAPEHLNAARCCALMQKCCPSSSPEALVSSSPEPLVSTASCLHKASSEVFFFFFT